jgi:hypothetical protein
MYVLRRASWQVVSRQAANITGLPRPVHVPTECTVMKGFLMANKREDIQSLDYMRLNRTAA